MTDTLCLIPGKTRHFFSPPECPDHVWDSPRILPLHHTNMPWWHAQGQLYLHKHLEYTAVSHKLPITGHTSVTSIHILHFLHSLSCTLQVAHSCLYALEPSTRDQWNMHVSESLTGLLRLHKTSGCFIWAGKIQNIFWPTFLPCKPLWDHHAALHSYNLTFQTYCTVFMIFCMNASDL